MTGGPDLPLLRKQMIANAIAAAMIPSEPTTIPAITPGFMPLRVDSLLLSVGGGMLGAGVVEVAGGLGAMLDKA